MKLKKSQIESICISLNYPIKNFTKARIRDNFIEKLNVVATQFNQEKNNIFTELCTKNEEGKSIIENNIYTFEGENSKKVQEELSLLDSEEIEIEGSKELIELIESTESALKVGMTTHLDEFILVNK